MSRVSAVVVTRNHREVIGACLGSLLAGRRPPDEIVVVDHASGDGTADLVRRDFRGVLVLGFPDNPGFGEGCNRALRVVSGDFVLLLNPDATVEPDCLELLVERLEADPKRGAAVPKLLCDDGRIHSAGLRVNRLGYACDRGCLEEDRGQYDRGEPVLAGSGAALLLRRDAVAAVGGFDPAYFLYYEDLDLCWRLWLAGHEVRYEPSAVAHHAAKDGPGSDYYRHFLDQRNRFRTLLKNLSPRSLVGVLPGLVGFEALSFVDLLRRFRFRAAFWRVLSWKWTFLFLSGTLRLRRAVQRRRRVTDRALEPLFVSKWGNP